MSLLVRTDSTCSPSPIPVDDHLSRLGRASVVRDLLDGLLSQPRRISSMFFYDAEGSRLFEEITRLPEYYPTRTEIPLIAAAAQRVADELDGTDIVELGSGDCTKISAFLDEVPQRVRESLRYLPVDVSRAAIEDSASDLVERFPRLAVHGVLADCRRQFDVIPRRGRRLICFFGSTLGNFEREDGLDFMKDLGAAMRPGDGLLLGLDRVKDPAVLERAYNDRRGVTAAFNRNILNVVNALAGTDLDPAAFGHVAFYEPRHARIEMHLRAERDVIATSPHLPRPLSLARGETIHTENSHKFTPAGVDVLADRGGLRVREVYTDPNDWFFLVHYVKD